MMREPWCLEEDASARSVGDGIVDASGVFARREMSFVERAMDKVRPVLNQINIVSRDPEASVAFYRRLGVDIPDANVWRTASGVHHINASEPDTPGRVHLDIDSVAFARRWNAGWTGAPDLAGRVVIGFGVPARADVDAIYDDITRAGHRGLQPPVDAFWGARYAIVEDPDGIAVGLMSPMDAARKAPPPEV
jgi:catechol 2,3-dioxygenase-like lactoylglutathione lyase family enzyme